MKVSLVVCVYNEKDTILTVLERVRQAPLIPGWEREIIVVDNASTDGTQDLLRADCDGEAAARRSGGLRVSRDLPAAEYGQGNIDTHCNP